MKIIIKALSIVARDNISDVINTTSIQKVEGVTPHLQVDVVSNGDFSTILPWTIVFITIAVVGIATTVYFSDSGEENDDHIDSVPDILRDSIFSTQQNETSRIGSPIEFRRSSCTDNDITPIDFDNFV